MGLTFTPGSAGDGAVPWLPMFETVELADFDRMDNYITAVEDHGGGEMTLTVDKVQARTVPGNGDILFLDLAEAVKTAGSGTHIVEARITVITRPGNVAGTPYVALAHILGSAGRTGFGPTMCMMLGASDSGRLIIGISGTVLAVSTAIGEIDTWRLAYRHATGTVVNQYGADFNAAGGTDANARWSTLTTTSPPDAANIETGYDQAGGQFFALCFTQLLTQPAGADTFRLKCEYRAIPISPAS